MQTNQKLNLPKNHPFLEIYMPPKLAPPIHEAASEIYKIASENYLENWAFYDAKLEKYCSDNRIILFDMWEEASDAFLNRKKITLKDCIEFLQASTETYFSPITAEEERTLREDSEQKDRYHRGEA